jgi:hypothetical protein
MRLRICGRASVLVVAGVTGLAAFTSARAATIALQQGTAGYTGHLDVQVRNDAANLGQSSNTTVNVSGFLPGATPTLLRNLQTWNLSDIPEGSTITSVTLTLGNRSDSGVSVDDGNTANDAGDPLYVLRTISAPVTEPPLVGTSTTAGSNWNNTFGSGTTLGAQVLSSANFDPEVGALILGNTFPSSSDFVAAVQAALDSPSNLFNFAVLSPETGSDRIAVQFGSNAATGTTVPAPPILTIDFVPEPASTALLVVPAALVALSRARRRRA